MSTFTAKTVSEAIEEGLKSLNVDKSNAEINIVQTNRKGFFGIGKRDAIVEIDVKKHQNASNTQEIAETPTKNIKINNQSEETTETKKRHHSNEQAMEDLVVYLKPIVEELGVSAELQPKIINRKFARINFKTEQEGLLIGKHGLTINALQNLAQIYLNHIGYSRLSIQLDTADYRHRRTEILKKLAEKTAREAVATGQPVYLDPMPSFERKVIHNQLEDNLYVNTFSSGREPYRAVVVEPQG
ncbi:protein jag [Apilactobacillus kunkeei]|uniref:RNA-binding cell elongation regulator Jag/EloR n=1 Tax=Apilactobacillus kunkeei TaxID=148814 RepID=UPI00110CBA53|nr:RNA-binding cell elongation regulator Jag/EloR [Apilactobacillus kunkeei]TMS99568.1 protein jag [Apilactobacillus kunkeei]